MTDDFFDIPIFDTNSLPKWPHENEKRNVFTNFSEEELPLYRQAIRHNPSLRISKVAYDVNGNRIKGYRAVISKNKSSNAGKRMFFAVLDKLIEQMKAGKKNWAKLPDGFIERRF